jgi:hypothetical protein
VHVPVLAVLVPLMGLAMVMGWRRILPGPARFLRIDAGHQGEPQ